MHLDGALQAVHPDCRGDHVTRFDRRLNYPTLPVAKFSVRDRWVYMTSAEQWPAEARRGRSAMVKTYDGADADLRAGTISTSAGPERLYQLPVPLIESPSVSWLAVGNRRSVKEMLKKVRQVGMYRRHGYGIVDRWEIEVVDEPPAAVLTGPDHVLRRHVPEAWCERVGDVVRSAPGRCLPPYWHLDLEPVVRAGTVAHLAPEVLAEVQALA